MTDTVVVKLDDIKRVFLLVEQMHDFFHQPMNFSNVHGFAEVNYNEIRAVYYDVLWEWFPGHVKDELKNR
ncbi:MAG: hypothetical protein KGO49_08550 [Gammaproteobacteria bacterium]|nr:hypothetical protein [Gammaproteobacteria bacterium]